MSRNLELHAIKKIFQVLDKLPSLESRKRVLTFVLAQPLEVDALAAKDVPEVDEPDALEELSL